MSVCDLAGEILCGPVCQTQTAHRGGNVVTTGSIHRQCWKRAIPSAPPDWAPGPEWPSCDCSVEQCQESLHMQCLPCALLLCSAHVSCLGRGSVLCFMPEMPNCSTNTAKTSGYWCQLAEMSPNLKFQEPGAGLPSPQYCAKAPASEHHSCPSWASRAKHHAVCSSCSRSLRHTLCVDMSWHLLFLLF